MHVDPLVRGQDVFEPINPAVDVQARCVCPSCADSGDASALARENAATVIDDISSVGYVVSLLSMLLGMKS